MDDQYDILARFYRELIATSGHWEKEQNVILKIISKLNIKYNNTILDAACGTGDALRFLYNLGYKELIGLDSSKNMIKEAINILPNIKYYNLKWNEIYAINEFLNYFDIIYIVSISILHVESIKELSSVLKALYSTLKPNGKLVIDNRMWERNNEGLIEVGRIINQYRYLCTSTINNEKFLMMDVCHYNKDRQIVEYMIKSKRHLYKIEVSYLRISTSLLKRLLYQSGFNKVENEKYTIWPYELIYAYK